MNGHGCDNRAPAPPPRFGTRPWKLVPALYRRGSVRVKKMEHSTGSGN